MAIKWIGASWKTDLKTGAPPDRDDRLYIDFRREECAEIAGSPTYTLIGSADNQPGSHNLTGGYAQYILPLGSSITVHVKAYPQFLHTTGSDQNVWGWYVDATHYLKLYYVAASDTFRAQWQNGGTARYLESQQFDDGVSYEDIDQWLEFTFTADLTTGDTTGAAFYVNGSAEDTAWSGAIDSFGSYNFNTFEVRSSGSTAGDYYVNHCRVFFTTVTAADVTNRFENIAHEEVYFPYNGCALGTTRCNITRYNYTDGDKGFVRSVSMRRGVENSVGVASSNTLDAELNNIHGEFSSEQYAAYDPTQDTFNGTSAQKYLRNRCGVILESWYGTDFEPVFVGKIDEGGFQRTTSHERFSTVRITAEDAVRDLAHEVKRRGRYYEDKKISDSTESNSLVHLIARLATEKDVYNFASNSSFENTTVGNSWASSSCTLTRSGSYALFGSYSGSAVYSSSGTVYQTVTFTGTEKLNVGTKWNFSIYIYTTAAFTGTLRLAEHDAGGSNNSSTTAVSVNDVGWKRYDVAHTVTDTDSDRLRISLEANSGTAYLDGAMLVRGSDALNFWVLNNNDGASGVESADDADSDSYDTIGFDVDAISITHPWAIVEEGVSIWDLLVEIGQAVAARYIGIDSAGTFKLRSPLKTGYSDPSAIETINDVMSVDATIDYETANKIIGHGVKIIKEIRPELLWSAEDSGSFLSDYSNFWGVDVANGGTFPDPTEYGDYWAKLESQNLPKGRQTVSAYPGQRT